MENVRRSIGELPWIALLLLTIFFDGIVGGLYRAGGKTTTAKIVGWIMILSFVLSIVAFISLPKFLGTLVHIITTICWIADIITVILHKKITLFAD
jgi:hypothetical protein